MKLVSLLHIFIILSVALPAFATEIDDLKKELDAKAKEIEELKQQEEEYRGAIGEKKHQAKTLEGLIVDFNQKIRNVEDSIIEKEGEISDVKLQIQQTELEIETKKETIKRTRIYIAATLREVYESDAEEIVELVLKYENFSEFFNQVEYRDLLQQDLRVRLDDITALKETLEQKRAALDSQHEEMEGLKQELERRNSVLAAQRTQKGDLLKDTRNEEWRYKEILKDVEAKQKAVQLEIFELEDALRRAIDLASIPTPRPGVLDWPTEGILSQGYGCTTFAKTSKSYPTCFHNGIDVAAAYGTPVKSARLGTVIAVQNAPYAYGQWIAIEHDNGLITLYGHLSLQSVIVGQAVDRGEVIGYMGSTGYSTGSHLHFTVYAPNTFSTQPSTIAGVLPIGATLNPFDYLP